MLWQAHLEEANLWQAHLDGAVLWQANLKLVRNLTQEQLKGAIGDEGTILPESPEGLTVPSCWVEYPELLQSVPWLWDADDFREAVLCGEGEEPLRLPLPPRD